MLILAVKKWRKEEDPDDPPSKWMTMLGEIKTWQAFGAGALLMLVAIKQWVFLLTALGVIGETGPSQWEWVLGFLFFLVVSFSLMVIPIVVYALAPAQSAQVLGRLQAWLARYNRVIAIGVSLVFGLWFLYKGITGLIG
jgi:threonine/homoserine/homoserine lactone efflux protein